MSLCSPKKNKPEARMGILIFRVEGDNLNWGGDGSETGWVAL